MRRIEDMIAEACKEVLGAEWDKMTGKQQAEYIMSFIAEAARRARAAEEKE